MKSTNNNNSKKQLLKLFFLGHGEEEVYFILQLLVSASSRQVREGTESKNLEVRIDAGTHGGLLLSGLLNHDLLSLHSGPPVRGDTTRKVMGPPTLIKEMNNKFAHS